VIDISASRLHTKLKNDPPPVSSNTLSHPESSLTSSARAETESSLLSLSPSLPTATMAATTALNLPVTKASTYISSPPFPCNIERKMTTKTKKNFKTTASTMATTMATVMTNTMKSAITMITGEKSVTERTKTSTAVATTTQMADDNIQTKLTRTATKPVKTEMIGDRKEIKTMVVEALVAATAKAKVIGKGKNTAATKETQMTKEVVITIISEDNKMKPKLDTVSNTPAAITSTPPSYRITSAASRPPPPMPPPSLPPPSSSDKEELLSIRTHPTFYGKADIVVLVRPAYSVDVTAMQCE